MKRAERNDITSLFQSHAGVQALTKALEKERFIALDGLRGSSQSIIVHGLRSRNRPILCIASDMEEAGYLYSDLEQLGGEGTALFFPSSYKRAVKYGHTDSAQQVLRAGTLAELSGQGNCPLIVSYPEAVAECVVAVATLEREKQSIRQGDRLDREFVRELLVQWGFERTDYVYEPGQFAMRGSLLDVFSYSRELPMRIDFFDDEVESIRLFEVESQLSVQTLTEALLMPDVAGDEYAEESFLSILPKDTIIVLPDRSFLEERFQSIYTDPPLFDDGEGFASLEDMQRKLTPPSTLMSGLEAFCTIAVGSGRSGNYRIGFRMQSQPLFHKNFDLLIDQLDEWKEAGYKLLLATASDKQYERVGEILAERGRTDLLPEHLSVTLHAGFTDETARLAVLTDHQLFDRYHKYNLKSDKARSGKVTLSLKELNQFSTGDYIVHIDHGIGQFGGLITMDTGGKRQEVIKLIYRNNDIIFVNLHSLHKLSKYKGGENATGVELSRLGSGAWQKIKDRTKTRVKDIARDLIRLYARRREEKGFAFSPDSYLQHELEASFIYEDTPDQERATTEVKADMESDRPMDRLICGDVGFGKTEVAIRAAFKAATDGKQVAVLVPTTVLAYQHYRTFSERLRQFPVRIEYISRGRSAKDIKAVLHDLAAGQIDIVIGTHRLVSNDVHFRDLGLLIIDEEQKFGVAVKEKLRKLQVNVDTLTMSATPIPRTLQFSLMGARDLSNISTPPPNRYPIATELARFSPDILREAVNFEMSRNGQAFVVHNRIENIEEIAAIIRHEVPDARVAVGHGRMAPAELERLILDFVHYEYDVLVATTIIENGIDVPNANTIIINDAHRYGLSELHQLRGRVGRSNKKAFCYLLSPPLGVLPDDSRRRLQAIENFSDLGSGIRIALQDLDIRGAGNVLGAEQSGFIADLGYEAYSKVFDEAVRELKAEEFAELYATDEKAKVSAAQFVVETTVESDMELSFAEDYVPLDSERILLYRELDNLSTDEELEAFRERMKDRFGQIPPEGEELIRVPHLRQLGRSLGIEKIVLRGGQMSLHLISKEDSPYYQSEAFGRLLAYIAAHTRRCEIRQTGGKRIVRIREVNDVLTACDVCKAIATTDA
ncbi:transcription-repair coupling factor [Porphyromonas loveana]|uniref:transcription-repair coupling factor n=1 Tax=Porphyromonas loveana TaxID=1884669 RepID=UPI00359F87B4